ncbi:MAG: NYN domain-containing protein [Ignavibacteriaceae bacterium]
MITYLIDGNNLIGKIKSLNKIQKKDRQGAREKMAFMIDNYFHNKKSKVFLYFDGFPGDAIKTSVSKIIYSENKTADEKIKRQIEKSSNSKNITVVSSDMNLAEFARVCSCTVSVSEVFAKLLSKSGSEDDEQKIIDSMSTDEFKKLFNV